MEQILNWKVVGNKFIFQVLDITKRIRYRRLETRVKKNFEAVVNNKFKGYLKCFHLSSFITRTYSFIV